MENNETKRKDCPLRHANGNCLSAGGFCTAVNNEICSALHNAYESGRIQGIKESKEWIDIHDRLPSEEELDRSPFHTFLVSSSEEVHEAVFNDIGKFFARNGMRIFGVTHWKNLPAPAAQEDEDYKSSKNTLIQYQYRDAFNYKTHYTQIVSGAITDEQIEIIEKSLIDGENFIADEVGLEFWREEEFDPECDHDYCEFCSDPFTLTTRKATCSLSVEELVEAFVKAAKNNWGQGGSRNV